MYSPLSAKGDCLQLTFFLKTVSLLYHYQALHQSSSSGDFHIHHNTVIMVVSTCSFLQGDDKSPFQHIF